MSLPSCHLSCPHTALKPSFILEGIESSHAEKALAVLVDEKLI